MRGLCVAGAGGFSRKDVDDLARVAAVHGAKGLAPCGWRRTVSGRPSPVPEPRDDGSASCSAWVPRLGTLLLFAADRLSVLEPSLGTLRVHLAERLGVPREGWRFTWILNFPMFEYDEREKRWKAQHHPFTRPRIQDAAELSRHPGELGTYAYDLVLNGVELGSGSLRVSDPAMQEAIFATLGLGKEEITAKFGFLVEAMDYGIPPTVAWPWAWTGW